MHILYRLLEGVVYFNQSQKEDQETLYSTSSELPENMMGQISVLVGVIAENTLDVVNFNWLLQLIMLSINYYTDLLVPFAAGAFLFTNLNIRSGFFCWSK